MVIDADDLVVTAMMQIVLVARVVDGGWSHMRKNFKDLF